MSNMVRIRPNISAQTAANGIYMGKITSVTIKTEPDKYNDGKPHDVIYFGVEIKTPTGPVKLRKLVSYVESWSDKSNMYKMLDDLECLPEPGTGFDFNSLVGKKVDVVVKNNNTQDGKTYSNIDRLLPRSLKKATEPTASAQSTVKTTTKKPVKAEEAPDEDDDYNFSDIDEDTDSDEDE